MQIEGFFSFQSKIMYISTIINVPVTVSILFLNFGDVFEQKPHELLLLKGGLEFNPIIDGESNSFVLGMVFGWIVSCVSM